MNNTQFRQLVFDTPARQTDGTPSSHPGTTPSAFVAKKSSFMTPRTIKGAVDVDFVRQVRERNAALQPTKKFQSSSAPKGVKFAKGYVDRARARGEEVEDGGSDKATRVKALEEQMKLGQISVEMFKDMRDQITGGEASNTHLVKGLDRKLLERVKKGEDVLGVGAGGVTTAEPVLDVDDELDKLGEQKVKTIRREKLPKGSMAPPSLASGKKRNRDEIMAEMKAQREAMARAKALPSLDSRWRKVGDSQRSRLEWDHKGREVLITVDEDGIVKRKVRKVGKESVGTGDRSGITAEMPGASQPVLGADAELPEPVAQRVPVDDEDGDIFDGVGAEYNPLGTSLEDADDSDDENNDKGDEEEGEVSASQETQQPRRNSSDSEPAAPDDKADITETGQPPHESKPAGRSYFQDTAQSTSNEPATDHLVGIQNVLLKAARLDRPLQDDDDRHDDETEAAHQARLKRRAQMLAPRDRDMDDMDLGFGSSRIEDEAEGDEDGKRVKLSEWKQGISAVDGESDHRKGSKEKRTRKPKKRKGDANSAADIMRVIEGRKHEAASK